VLSEIEDFLLDVMSCRFCSQFLQVDRQKDKIKLSATNSKAFNVMKQRMRKYNKGYEKEIAEYRAVRDGCGLVC
jgi:hypothetical protein